MRRAAKVDSTQRAIVEVLRAHGCRVMHIRGTTPGVPDLMVLRKAMKPDPRGFLDDYVPGWDVYLVECKTGRGKLRPAQQQLVDDGWPVVVLRGVDEALAWLRTG